MYQKLKIIYLHHFKFLIFLNLFLSLYLIQLFCLKGFDKVGLYNLAIFFKLVAFATTFGIEKLFFGKHIFYFQNLGLSYRKIFGIFYLLDFALFILLFLISWLWKSYM